MSDKNQLPGVNLQTQLFGMRAMNKALLQALLHAYAREHDQEHVDRLKRDTERHVAAMLNPAIRCSRPGVGEYTQQQLDTMFRIASTAAAEGPNTEDDGR